MYYKYIFSGSLMLLVSENEISALVDSFYGKIREDNLLGPIFETALAGEWGPHLEKMKAFWSSVMLATRRYKGNPMMTHLRLPPLTREHLDRWLKLWSQTTSEICSEPAASIFLDKAEMIGERFLFASAYHHALAHGHTLETA